MRDPLILFYPEGSLTLLVLCITDFIVTIYIGLLYGCVSKCSDSLLDMWSWFSFFRPDEVPTYTDCVKWIRNGDLLKLKRALCQTPSLVSEVDHDNATLLHHAAKHGKADIATVLLEQGSDFKALDKLGYGAFASAIKHNYPSVLRVLHRYGDPLDGSYCSDELLPPIILAAALGRVEILKLFKEFELNFKVTEKTYGQTAVCLAVCHNMLEAVKFLLENNLNKITDVAISGSVEISLLYFAAKNNVLDIFNYLLEQPMPYQFFMREYMHLMENENICDKSEILKGLNKRLEMYNSIIVVDERDDTLFCETRVDKVYVSSDFFCPISCSLILDPVTDKQGNLFNRADITRWLQSNSTSPVSRQPLSIEGLGECLHVRNELQSIYRKIDIVYKKCYLKSDIDLEDIKDMSVNCTP